MDAERRERDDAGQRRRCPEGGVDRYGRGGLDPTQVALAIGATGLVVIALVLLFVDPRLLPLVAVPAGAGLAVAHSLRNGPARQIDQMERLRQAELALAAASSTEAAASDLADHAIALLGASAATVIIEGIGEIGRAHV